MGNILIKEAGVPDRNGRIYPIDALEQAAITINDRANNNSPMMGEILQEQRSTMDLNKVSHIITSAIVENGKLYVNIKPLKTPMGNILTQLEEGNVKLNFGMRGTGNIDENRVVTNFQIDSIDVISPDSF
jgi:hypothetical protein